MGGGVLRDASVSSLRVASEKRKKKVPQRRKEGRDHHGDEERSFLRKGETEKRYESSF